MKVILLAPTPPPYGGIAGWTERMLKTKLKNGWKVSIVDEKVIGGRTVFGNQAKKNVLVEIKRCLKIWGNLLLELKDPEAKIVQACIPAGANSMAREIISAIITRVYRKKFIIHFRCTLPNMIKKHREKILFKILVKLSHDVFVLNEASAEFLKKQCNKKTFELIPNFIEIDEIESKKKINHKIEKIVYVGGVIAQKGCDQIYEIAPKFPCIQFRLVGNDGMGKSVPPNNVKLLGEQPKETVQKELRDADVFIFLSRYSGEGFSNALAEAMAHALPCIVTDWAANADMIENKGGYVVPILDNKAVEEAIEKLTDANLRKNMGEWNQKKVKTKYSRKIITDMYVDAYEKLL